MNELAYKKRVKELLDNYPNLYKINKKVFDNNFFGSYSMAEVAESDFPKEAYEIIDKLLKMGFAGKIKPSAYIDDVLDIWEKGRYDRNNPERLLNQFSKVKNSLSSQKISNIEDYGAVVANYVQSTLEKATQFIDSEATSPQQKESYRKAMVCLIECKDTIESKVIDVTSKDAFDLSCRLLKKMQLVRTTIVNKAIVTEFRLNELRKIVDEWTAINKPPRKSYDIKIEFAKDNLDEYLEFIENKASLENDRNVYEEKANSMDALIAEENWKIEEETASAQEIHGKFENGEILEQEYLRIMQLKKESIMKMRRAMDNLMNSKKMSKIFVMAGDAATELYYEVALNPTLGYKQKNEVIQLFDMNSIIVSIENMENNDAGLIIADIMDMIKKRKDIVKNKIEELESVILSEKMKQDDEDEVIAPVDLENKHKDINDFFNFAKPEKKEKGSAKEEGKNEVTKKKEDISLM